MSRLNRDVVVAVFLLLLCGVFFAATFNIKEMQYATIGADVWPRLILLILFVLSLIYLFQSLQRASPEAGQASGARGWAKRYRNALWCYVLFALFLVTLPFLGLLIGGVLFVFAALTVMGERTLRMHLVHAGIAIGTVGLMWAIFTYWLRVILPQGQLLNAW